MDMENDPRTGLNNTDLGDSTLGGKTEGSE
jgi:hypothetical protein